MMYINDCSPYVAFGPMEWIVSSMFESQTPMPNDNATRMTLTKFLPSTTNKRRNASILSHASSNGATSPRLSSPPTAYSEGKQLSS